MNFYFIYKKAFEISATHKLKQIDETIGFFFAIFFLITINFIFIPFLFSIIIQVYNTLRKKMQLRTEALA